MSSSLSDSNNPADKMFRLRVWIHCSFSVQAIYDAIIARCLEGGNIALAFRDYYPVRSPPRAALTASQNAFQPRSGSTYNCSNLPPDLYLKGLVAESVCLKMSSLEGYTHSLSWPLLKEFEFVLDSFLPPLRDIHTAAYDCIHPLPC